MSNALWGQRIKENQYLWKYSTKRGIFSFKILVYVTPSPDKLSLWTTAFTLKANSSTESCKILFATSSPASAHDTTTGTSAAIRAQEGST